MKTTTNLNHEQTTWQRSNVKSITKQIKLLLLFIAVSSTTIANNLVISNVKLSGQNTILHYSLVNFDISWDNSWRVSSGPSNWDAAWVFVKYRLKDEQIWNHATLHWGGRYW